jgi:hypothetical protein
MSFALRSTANHGCNFKPGNKRGNVNVEPFTPISGTTPAISKYEAVLAAGLFALIFALHWLYLNHFRWDFRGALKAFKTGVKAGEVTGFSQRQHVSKYRCQLS